jgi:hypothetical protein
VTAYRFRVASDGVVHVLADDHEKTAMHPEGDGFRLTGSGSSPERRIVPARDTAGGFLLVRRDGAAEVELGRSTPLEDEVEESAPTYLLLDDGRLFRLLLRGPEDPRYELCCWESTAPYLEARRVSATDWSLVPTLAGRELTGWDVILPLVATTVLGRNR